MGSRSNPRISFVLATHNRTAVVEHTLRKTHRCGLGRRDYEVLVVDNASEDGTPEAIRTQVDLLLRLRRNSGSCAKSYGLNHARGEFIVFLDDDSYPKPGAIRRMIEHFENDTQLAAAGFTIHLPNGERECGALPGVFVGCGAGFRASALRACGGLDRSFFMQAEEYDLCFRLAAHGWNVEVFDDLHVEHLKTPHARRSERTTYYDIRNNLRVIARYLPREYYHAYRADFVQRYGWLSAQDGHREAFLRGRRAGARFSAWERWTHRTGRLPSQALERFFQWEAIRRRMVALADSGVRRVLFADLGKNIYAFHRAAELARIDIVAVADDRFAAPDRTYRDVPILPVSQVMTLEYDAVVVSNCASVFAQSAAVRFRKLGPTPVHAWFGEAAVVPGCLNPGRETADDRGVCLDIGPKTALGVS